MSLQFLELCRKFAGVEPTACSSSCHFVKAASRRHSQYDPECMVCVYALRMILPDEILRSIKLSLSLWWSEVVGVAGTQATERPQQAAYNSNNILFLQTKPTQIQRTHSQTYTVSAGRKESKQKVQSNRSSKQPNHPNLCFLGLLQLQVSLRLHNQLSQIKYQTKA